MAPVKKFSITLTSLTALALVMSACAGNLEAKKLGARTGVQKVDPQSQKLEATEDGASTFNENCDSSDELKTKAEGEEVITVEALIDGKSNKYVLSRGEVFASIQDNDTQKENMISAKLEGDKSQLLCQNSKEGSETNIAAIDSALEIDSNDGSSTEAKVAEFITSNSKVGARLFVVPNDRKIQDLKKIYGDQVIITKDAEGTIRIRTLQGQEVGNKIVRSATLTVYKAMTAEEAKEARAEAEAKAKEEQAQQDEEQPTSAQSAADAAAKEAGIQIPTSTTQAQAQGQSQNNDDDGEMTEEERQALQEKVTKRQQEISAELNKKLAERHAAEQEAKARAIIAENENKTRRALPPCVRSSQDAACPNDGIAGARAAYQAQQAAANSATTTSTTQPRSGRAADENDVKNGPRGH